MANTIQLAIGDGTFDLHVPGLKSLDNLVGVEANLANEGDVATQEKPVISIRPVSYQNENLTCSYHIHFKNNSASTQSVSLKLSVLYRDYVVNSDNYAVLDAQNTFTNTNTFNQTVTLNYTPQNDLDAINKKYVEDNFTTKQDEQELHDDVYNNFLKKTASEKQTVEPQVDFKLTPTVNGVPISGVGVDLTPFVRKDEILKTLCEECGWVGDLQSQITRNGQDIDELQAKQSNTYILTKEITIDKAKISQTLMGSFYVYNMDYDISEWDNNEWNLEAITLKNIHIDDINGRSGEVHEVVKKAITSIVFDENNLYCNMLTPKVFNYSTGVVKLELSCSYSRVLTKEKEGE